MLEGPQDWQVSALPCGHSASAFHSAFPNNSRFSGFEGSRQVAGWTTGNADIG